MAAPVTCEELHGSPDKQKRSHPGSPVPPSSRPSFRARPPPFPLQPLSTVSASGLPLFQYWFLNPVPLSPAVPWVALL